MAPRPTCASRRRRAPLLLMLLVAATAAAALIGGAAAASAADGERDAGLELASALFGGSTSSSSESSTGSGRALADAIWGALSSGSDDARARVLLASLLGLDPTEAAAARAGDEEPTMSSGNGRALLGFAVEEGMAPLSRYSATMQDIVTPKGYPLEEHKVTTDDGYVLTMHRIPAGRYRHTELPHGVLPSTRAAAPEQDAAAPPSPKPAVLLHHGITLSSASFAVLNANESLAYVLADAGFDVWMANSRGNTFSWEHRDGPTAMRDPRYWRVSMDAIALKDLPAQMDYALDVTKTKRLGFVGHSQGCTLLMALLAERPDYNDRVTVAAQMGPVTFVKELQAPFLKGGVQNKVDQILKRLAWVDPMPTRVTAPVLAGACRRWPTGGSCAKGMAYSFYGPSVHMTPDDYVEIGSVWPAGVASRNLEHWAQMMRRAGEPRLTKYDYGTNCTQREASLKGNAHPFYESCNQAEYDGAEQPPEYDLKKVTAPLALFEGALDVLATAADVERLKKAVNPGVVVFEKLYPTYNHVDFVFARNALHKGDLAEVLMRYAPRSFD